MFIHFNFDKYSLCLMFIKTKCKNNSSIFFTIDTFKIVQTYATILNV